MAKEAQTEMTALLLPSVVVAVDKLAEHLNINFLKVISFIAMLLLIVVGPVLSISD